MTDIRTISAAGPAGLDFDWAMGFGALKSDDGLETYVINSLFSDRTAAADDVIPDNTGDRRGWWGDQALDDGTPDPIGSRLWLLSRAKATTKTAAKAREYAQEALQWLIDDGVASRIDITAQYVTREQLRLTVNIIRQVAGKPVSHRFDYVWNPAEAANIAPKPVAYLGDEHGNMLVTEDGTPITLF